jgi:hypothetical protein
MKGIPDGISNVLVDASAFSERQIALLTLLGAFRS